MSAEVVDVIVGSVICGRVEAACICGLEPGHVEVEHVCQCGGSWLYDDDGLFVPGDLPGSAL